MESIFFLLIILAIYFLPSMVAEKRKCKYQQSVLIINLFLGWTFLFWVVALAIAFIGDYEKNNIA